MSILTVLVLVAIAGLVGLVLWRVPARPLIYTVSAFLLLIAIGVFVLNSSADFGGGKAHPERSIAILAVVGLLVASSLVPLESDAPSPRGKRKPKRKSASPQPSKTPTLTSLGGKKNNELGTQLTRYETMDRIGIGGMATVYRARRKDDNRTVALKIPQDKFIADARFVRRFHREADVLMKLNHPNVVRVFEHNNEGATHFIAMELIEGEALESLVETRRLTLEQSVQIIKQVSDALRYVHKQGIIHRDIKPGNVMVTKNAIKHDPNAQLELGSVKLMDFGIAAGRVLTRLTMTGARVGTPVYMSPEQARGNKIDHRTDIYSLGLVFYEMVTGQTAFKGGYEAVVQAQIFQTPTPPRQINLEVPPKLNDLIMKMIDKDPDKRPTLTEVMEEIDRGLFDQQADLQGPAHLVVSLNTRKGPIRVLDLNGNLERSFGQIAAGQLPGAPVAIDTDKDMNFYVSILEYRSNDPTARLLRKFDRDHKQLLAFGAYGMKPGELLYPLSLSVAHWNQLYVLDGESYGVSRFDLEGNYLGRFGGRGTGQGLFEDPRHVVAAADGMVYVLDYGNRRIQRFSPEGEYVNRYSFKVNKDSPDLRQLDGMTAGTNGTVYISDASAARIRTLLPPNGQQGPYAIIEALQGEDSSQTLELVLDPQGNLYAARRGGHLIRKFAPDCSLLQTIETYSPIMSLAMYVRPK
jgi:eukaryotic-like serine/threonine-protein kinase